MNIKSIYKFISPKFETLFLDYKFEHKPRYYDKENAHETLYQLINRGRASYTSFLNKVLQYQDTFQKIKPTESALSKNPCWINGFFPGLDIVSLYTIIAEYKPRLYVEIGSGNSTKVAFKAKNEMSPDTKIVSIDPHPRIEIDNLADEIIRLPFEKIDFDLLNSLSENDVLFIDNSHYILPNSDSMVFFMEVLPNLKKGVIVHLHDIYLPYDYPQFMCDRGYSEQYGLAFYIIANSAKYKPLVPNYFISQDEELSNIISPIWDHPNTKSAERHGGSFWLKIDQ